MLKDVSIASIEEEYLFLITINVDQTVFENHTK